MMARTKPDPGVQAMLDEANTLPECAAQEALLERAAAAAETLGDLDTAWQCRCRILGSSGAHAEPRFETVFMCMAWCLAVSDADPGRFEPSRVLWQYKWVATAAPKYGSVPRSILERLIEDMDARYIRAGWGRRAGLHKRLEMHLMLGEPERAFEFVERCRKTPRDRGSDCVACEAGSLADALISIGRLADGVAAARGIIAGRLSCATVPHSTFGNLLDPLVQLGRLAEARACFARGRRLVGELSRGAGDLIGPYLAFAAEHEDPADAAAMLRSRIADAAEARSDMDRALNFGHLDRALRAMALRGVQEVDVAPVAGLWTGGPITTIDLASRCRAIAASHAAAMDARNGNDTISRRCLSPM